MPDSHQKFYLTGGTLLRIDRVSDQVRPELAESWTVDPAGRFIEFHLRSGLKFSDGTPLTAEDVARTLRMAFDPANSSPVGDPFPLRTRLPRHRCRFTAARNNSLSRSQSRSGAPLRSGLHRPSNR